MDWNHDQESILKIFKITDDDFMSDQTVYLVQMDMVTLSNGVSSSRKDYIEQEYHRLSLTLKYYLFVHLL